MNFSWDFFLNYPRLLTAKNKMQSGQKIKKGGLL